VIQRQLRNDDPTLTKLQIQYGSYIQESNLIYSPGTWEREGEAIGRNTHLKELEIADPCWINEDELELFFQGLSDNRSIGKLSFKAVTLTGGEPFYILFPFFEYNNNLETLEIEYCHIDDDGYEHLFSALAKSCSLKKLTISPGIEGCTDTDLYDEEVLAKSLLRHVNLITLNLEGNCMGNRGCRTMTSFVCDTRTILSTLNLEGNNIGDEGVKYLTDALSKTSTQLKYLYLAYNDNITSVGWKHICDLLRKPDIGLEGLSMSELSNEVMLDLASSPGCHMLKTLQICNTSHTDISCPAWKGLFGLLRSPTSVLEDLSLRGNELTGESTGCLTSALANNSTLRSLDLSCCRNITTAGWDALSDCLRNPKSELETLNIQWSLYNDNGEATALLADALASNRKLKNLLTGFSRRGIYSDKMRPLFQILCKEESIMATYQSNHYIQNLGVLSSYETTSHLELNKNTDKAEVARQKIIDVHFSNFNVKPVIDMQPFIDMDIGVIPHAIAWIAKGSNNQYNWRNEFYRYFVRNMPSLFDIKGRTKTDQAKRQETEN